MTIISLLFKKIAGVIYRKEIVKLKELSDIEFSSLVKDYLDNIGFEFAPHITPKAPAFAVLQKSDPDMCERSHLGHTVLTVHQCSDKTITGYDITISASEFCMGVTHKGDVVSRIETFYASNAEFDNAAKLTADKRGIYLIGKYTLARQLAKTQNRTAKVRSSLC
jgi:hypothetical protein